MDKSKCARCHQNVYLAERMIAAGKFWHKQCFKCIVCSRPLDALALSEHRGEIYCRACYAKYCGTADFHQATSYRSEAHYGYSVVCEEKCSNDFRKGNMISNLANGSSASHYLVDDFQQHNEMMSNAPLRSIGFSHLPVKFKNGDELIRRKSEDKYFSDDGFKAVNVDSKHKSASSDIISMSKEIFVPVEYCKNHNNKRTQIFIPINQVNKDSEGEKSKSDTQRKEPAKEISPNDGVFGLVKSASQIVPAKVGEVKKEFMSTALGTKDLVIGMTNMMSSNWDSKVNPESKTRI